jgi:hypothetical protein
MKTYSYDAFGNSLPVQSSVDGHPQAMAADVLYRWVEELTEYSD